MNIVLIGAPGSGKGTLAKMLADKMDFSVISMGDCLRKESKKDTTLGQMLKPLLGTGGLVPDDMATLALENELNNISSEKGFLFDGYPRSLPQIMALDDILETVDKNIDYVIHLNVDEETILKRIKSRATIEGRKDDQDEATVQKRLAIFHKTTKPVIAHYKTLKLLRTIDASGTPEQMYNEAMKSISNLPVEII